MRVAVSEKTIDYYIQEHDLVRHLNEEMLSHLQIFHFPIYSTIYMEQDEQHFLYFLVEGQVQCSHYHLNGKLAVIALSTPFTVIGDMEILTEERINSNVIATENTVMLGIEREIVERYGSNDPRFLRFLIDQLRDKVMKTNTLHMNQLLPVSNRLALFMLAETKPDAPDSITLPDKEHLASLLGTTTRHLNRVLREFVDSGLIGAGYPRVTLLDREGLEDVST